MGIPLQMEQLLEAIPMVLQDSSSSKFNSAGYSTQAPGNTKVITSKLRSQGFQLMSALKALKPGGMGKSGTAPDSRHDPKHNFASCQRLKIPNSHLLDFPVSTVFAAETLPGPPFPLPSSLVRKGANAKVAHPGHNSSFEDMEDDWAENSGGNGCGILPGESMGKTPVDSEIRRRSPAKDEDCHPPEKRQRTRKSANPVQSSTSNAPPNPNNGMATRQESDFGEVTPSIVTVERAAAAKIHLETYFNRLLAPCPSPRSVRENRLRTALSVRIAENTITSSDVQLVWQQFYRQESEHLRKVRAMNVQSIRALNAPRGSSLGRLDDEYELVDVLGRGSFGTVNLVRERTAENGHDPTAPSFGSVDGESAHGKKPLYALKIMRKSRMLRKYQEGHLRAERDFLVAAEGSRWILPLVASFQDTINLYLLMEYMPGGDFLSYLMWKDVLTEAEARFYVAEMVLGVEEVHTLNFIHRDVKPENFLMSASGHLKISDFGLAFNGHWSHNKGYYSSHRDSLKQKLSVTAEGAEEVRDAGKNAKRSQQAIERYEKPNLDSQERLLDWRNRCGNRKAAMSGVGTSQYMAPEVINEQSYDARCDWWSIGVILYECIYGFSPFHSDTARSDTRKNISNHETTFSFPSGAPVSRQCRDLIRSLVRDKAERLCSERYRFKDRCAEIISSGVAGPSSYSSPRTPGGPTMRPISGHDEQIFRDYAGRFVFPYDAEDIKSHVWFSGVQWERLHEKTPPFVPHLDSIYDTRYFKVDTKPLSLSQPRDSLEMESTRAPDSSPQSPNMPNIASPAPPEFGMHCAEEREIQHALRGFRPGLQKLAMEAIQCAYDSARLRVMNERIDSLVNMPPEDRVALKEIIRRFGRKKPDPVSGYLVGLRNSKNISMEVRKRTAFPGYEWRRKESQDLRTGLGTVSGPNAADTLAAYVQGLSGVSGSSDGEYCLDGRSRGATARPLRV